MGVRYPLEKNSQTHRKIFFEMAPRIHKMVCLVGLLVLVVSLAEAQQTEGDQPVKDEDIMDVVSKLGSILDEPLEDHEDHASHEDHEGSHPVEVAKERHERATTNDEEWVRVAKWQHYEADRN